MFPWELASSLRRRVYPTHLGRELSHICRVWHQLWVLSGRVVGASHRCWSFLDFIALWLWDGLGFDYHIFVPWGWLTSKSLRLFKHCFALLVLWGKNKEKKMPQSDHGLCFPTSEVEAHLGVGSSFSQGFAPDSCRRPPVGSVHSSWISFSHKDIISVGLGLHLNGLILITSLKALCMNKSKEGMLNMNC